MKRVILGIMLFLFTALAACNNNKQAKKENDIKESINNTTEEMKEGIDKAGKATEKAIDNVEDAANKAADKTKETIDKAGDKAKEAWDDTKKTVNEAADKSKLRYTTDFQTKFILFLHSIIPLSLFQKIVKTQGGM